MSEFHQYDPTEVALSWRGINITGYADGTFIEVERDEDGFTKYVGALGDVARARNMNRTGSITVTLMAVSPVNDLIAAIALSDEQFMDGFGPIAINDFNGRTKCNAAYAWVKKLPKIERGKESGTIQWVFDCAQLNILPGGNLV